MKSRPIVPRAPKGSIASARVLRLDADMDKRLVKAAGRAGISVTEWVRRAIRAALRDVNSTNGV